MKTLHFVVLVILIAVPFGSAATNEPLSDASIREKLVGTWIIDRKLTKVSAKGTATFFREGTFTSQATMTANGKERKVAGEGKWEVKEGMLIETVTKSIDSSMVGHVTRDTILKIDGKELMYRTERGETVTRMRQK
jgi:hypothetical protein